MMAKISDTRSAMQVRHLAAIAEFTTEVQHLKGKANVVADALSRLEIDSAMLTLGIDFRELAPAQQLDSEAGAVRNAITNLRLQDVEISGHTLLCDISLGRPRPWFPAAFHRTIFQALHSLSHTGDKATARLVGEQFVWHGLKNYVARWARECLAYQRAKIHQHVRAPLEKVPVTDSQLESINFDLMSPLPPSQGFSYLLMIVDRFLRWPDAIPFPDISSIMVARAFLDQWVSRFGVLAEIVSDRGAQFISQLWSDIALLLGTSLHQTTNYHPQANGLVELFHWQLKASLSACLSGHN